MTNYKSWDEFETARILFFRLKFLSLLLLYCLSSLMSPDKGATNLVTDIQDDSKECMLWFCFILGLSFIFLCSPASSDHFGHGT